LGTPSSATVVIADNDVVPGTVQLSAATYSASESAHATIIPVTRTGGSSGPLSVNYSTSDGTGSAGKAYTATSGLLQWADGDSIPKNITVPLLDQGLTSGSQTFSIALTSNGGSLGAPASAIVTIADDDVIPGTLEFSAAAFATSESAKTVTLQVDRTGGSSNAVTVNYQTIANTAVAAVAYTAVSGTLSWADGDMSPRTIVVPVLDQNLTTGSQTFSVALTDVTGGATLGSPNMAAVTIADNDVIPGTLQLSAAGYSTSSNAGWATIQVTRTGGSSGPVSVAYATGDGSAQAGVDYTPVAGTLQWNDGDAAVKTISIPVFNLQLTENSKFFTIRLAQAAGGATLGSPGSATVTILENDGLPGVVQFSSGTYSVDEAAGTITIPVVRSGGLDAISVVASTQDGTGTNPVAYSGVSTTLSWANGDTSARMLTVNIVDRQLTTGSQTFAVQLTSPTGGASLGSPSVATVTINDDDPVVTVALTAISGSRVRLGNSLTYQAVLSGTKSTAVTWTVNGVTNGNAQVGTVVNTGNGTATYNAPIQMPASGNLVTLTAISTLQPTAAASLSVAIQNPIPTLSSVTPSSVDPGTTSIVLSGTNFLSSSQVFMNGTVVAATFNNSGQLTVPVTLTVPGTYLFNVYNPDPGGVASSVLAVTVNGSAPTTLVTPDDASRFLDQATFGATSSEIQKVANIGFQAWLNEQFTTPAVSHVPYIDAELQTDHAPCAPADHACNSSLYFDDPTSDGIWQSFFSQAINGEDQLRQRVAYALSQFLVISNGNAGATGWQARGFGAYYDLLENDGLGNFRQLLQDVTLSPEMGQFLSTLQNEGQNPLIHPDENYAREVMQLFTIGLYMLNPDGTQQLDQNGNPIPTYGLSDVEGLSSVFTGFSWNVPAGYPDNYTPNPEWDWWGPLGNVGPMVGADLLPMKSYANHHSLAQKQFLGVTIPASSVSDPDGDLKIALDTLFNHPNTPPFVCMQLIQHLVTSNPSPAYVGRVSAVFQNDGNGVRGNMQAVISAILLDPEARDSAAAYSNPQAGKVRETLLSYLKWARAFNAQSYSGAFSIGTPEDRTYGLGEMSLRAPSVFNWFAPSYVPPGTSIAAAGLVAPEMQMTDVVTTPSYLNYMENAIGSNLYTYSTGGPEVFSTYSAEVSLATNPDQLVDHIDLLLLSGSMSSFLRGQILSAVNAIAIPTGDQTAINTALAARVQTAIFLTMASPEFAAQI
jgi:uncharacterized protein (DUF1800 family)